MRLLIKGFKIPTTDMQVIEETLNTLQEKAIKRGRSLYATLFSTEIETVVDDISLNVIKRPENMSIYNYAKSELDKKIAWATANNAITAYNFAVQAAVFTYKNETYIKLNVQNDKLASEIRHLPDAEDFNVYDTETNQNKEIESVWNEIAKIYSNGHNPLVRQIYPCGPIEAEWDNIKKKFSTREERADVRVRHKITANVLNLIGMGQTIPPHRLFSYLDEALEMLSNANVQTDCEQLKFQILPCIVNITETEVKRNPTDEIKKEE